MTTGYTVGNDDVAGYCCVPGCRPNRTVQLIIIPKTGMGYRICEEHDVSSALNAIVRKENA